MIIRRIFETPFMQPQELEFELTPEELRQAYYEQEAIYDRLDMEHYIEENEESLLYQGYSKDYINKLKEYLDDMGSELRRCIDKYDMSWEYARDEAFRRIVERNRFNKGS